MRPAALAALALVTSAFEPEPEPEPPVKVMALTVKAAPPRAPGDGFGAKVYGSEAELAKATTKAAAAEAAMMVRFDSQAVAVVRYRVGGPPFPDLRHEIKKKERAVVFYHPEPAGPVGHAVKEGVAFFAVTKGAAVRYAPAP